MTANIKALKLIRQFKPHWADVNETISRNHAKRCATICADEIIRIAKYYDEQSEEINFWQQVKKEINKR